MKIAEDEVLQSPAKPSLMMRLFRSGDSQKTLLKAMFDEKENTPHSWWFVNALRLQDFKKNVIYCMIFRLKNIIIYFFLEFVCEKRDMM